MRDATAVARLRAAGAVIIGKTVTTDSPISIPAPTRNPHDPERTPGGSSSGSAAAVAAGMVPLAIGSQTNGSVIRPAAFCGVYGCKPTHGLISRAGALMLSRPLDHVGVFARSLADTALLSTCWPATTPTIPIRGRLPRRLSRNAAERAAAAAALRLRAHAGLGQGRCRNPRGVRGAGQRLGDGATRRPAGGFAAAWDDHRTIMAADMAHNLGAVSSAAATLEQDACAISLPKGARVSAVRYLAAREEARRYAAGISEIFKQYDAILTPARRALRRRARRPAARCSARSGR